ncbi:hypothetical protein [Propionivibrio sp.]|uniref:hypothetical protein n=1 Tax=Propionivibrio sp. TaxID=2212460 RepID=UPI0025E76718|nr:hypothetical protein [Propionivibrio sp.]MBK8745948.1 cytochrome c [Propionivibrio sp.]
MWSAPIHAAEADGRQLVEMSSEARAELRAEMLDFQTALHLIVGALAEQHHTAAEIAGENKWVFPAMGRHRNAPTECAPGMFMPNEMQAIARSMHAASSDFAKWPSAATPPKHLGSLTAVTGACVACHRSYRIQ